MNIEIMQEVLEVFHRHQVTPDNLYDALNETLQYANSIYWEKCLVSVPILYALKDTVWFNLEHLENNGAPEGVVDLRHLGSRFPTFASFALRDVYTPVKEVISLNREINQILKAWSPRLVFFHLNLGDRTHLLNDAGDVKVSIIDRSRSLEKPLGDTMFSVIKDSDGNGNNDTVIGIKENTVAHGPGNLLYSMLSQLEITTRRAMLSGKGLRLDLEAYD